MAKPRTQYEVLQELSSMTMSRPGVDHLVCCDPGIALCGADQRGEVIGIGPPDAGRLCTACAALDGDPSYRCSSGCPGDEVPGPRR